MSAPRSFTQAQLRAAVIASAVETHLNRTFRNSTPQEIALAFALLLTKKDRAAGAVPESRALRDLAILAMGGLQSLDLGVLGTMNSVAQAETDQPDVLTTEGARARRRCPQCGAGDGDGCWDLEAEGSCPEPVWESPSTDPTIVPQFSHVGGRMRTPAELSAGLRALRDHLLGGARDMDIVCQEAALYIDGVTDSLREHMAEIRRLRGVIRINALRWNPALSHEQIDEVIHGK